MCKNVFGCTVAVFSGRNHLCTAIDRFLSKRTGGCLFRCGFPPLPVLYVCPQRMDCDMQYDAADNGKSSAGFYFSTFPAGIDVYSVGINPAPRYRTFRAADCTADRGYSDVSYCHPSAGEHFKRNEGRKASAGGSIILHRREARTILAAGAIEKEKAGGSFRILHKKKRKCSAAENRAAGLARK